MDSPPVKSHYLFAFLSSFCSGSLASSFTPLSRKVQVMYQRFRRMLLQNERMVREQRVRFSLSAFPSDQLTLLSLPSKTVKGRLNQVPVQQRRLRQSEGEGNGIGKPIGAGNGIALPINRSSSEVTITDGNTGSGSLIFHLRRIKEGQKIMNRLRFSSEASSQTDRCKEPSRGKG